jgi:hypothetical protein
MKTIETHVSEKERSERVRTWAHGDVCGRLAGLGQAERLGGVDLEPLQAGVVLVLDQHAQALRAGLHHGLEPRAALPRGRRRRRLLLHVRQARLQAYQRVHTLGLVRRDVAAHSRGRHGHRRDEEDERPTRFHGGQMEEMLVVQEYLVREQCVTACACWRGYIEGQCQCGLVGSGRDIMTPCVETRANSSLTFYYI